MRIPLVLVGSMMTAAACNRADAPETGHEPATYSVHVNERASARMLESDTLEDDARITMLIPEPDGDAIALMVMVPSRGIASSLMLADRVRPSARLVWPDSVLAVRWLADHRLAFSSTTGTSNGVQVIGDVHAETIEFQQGGSDDTPGDSAAPPTVDPLNIASLARARATQYVDSVRVQPLGEPERGGLRYMVSSVIPAPDDSIAAVHVFATDGQGQRFNPSWLLVDVRPAGTVVPIDSIVGAAELMPERAAAWTEPGRFVFAREVQVREAVFRRGSTGVPSR